MSEPKCVAVDEWFDLRCGAPATLLAAKDGREGCICRECEPRAISAGWAVRDLRERAE